jgi:hypothetical protein
MLVSFALRHGSRGLTVKDDISLVVFEWCTIRLRGLGLLNSLEIVAAFLLVTTLARVFHVGHDALETACIVKRMVRATIIKIVDLGPLLHDSFGCELDVDWEAVAASSLPSRSGEPAHTALVETASWLGRLVRAEQNNKRGHVVGLQTLDHLLGHDGARHSGAGVGCDGVDEDVVLLALESERLGETENTALGGSVVGLPKVSVDAAGGSGVEDAAILLLEHVWPRGFGAGKGASEMHLEDGIPQVVGHVGKGLVAENACVVDEDVDAAIRIDCALDHRLAVDDVCLVANRLATELLNLLNDGIRVHEVVDHNLGAEFGKLQAVCATETGRISFNSGNMGIQLTLRLRP